jgi:threonine dehydratase
MLAYADIEAARRRLLGAAIRTPVLTSRQFDLESGASVFFKAENLQRAGAFKFRGAYNKLKAATEQAPVREVVAYSSGNHAQAVALVSKLLGLKATIVMPKDAPAAKLAATRGYGAEVVLYDRYRESRTAARFWCLRSTTSSSWPDRARPRRSFWRTCRTSTSSSCRSRAEA